MIWTHVAAAVVAAGAAFAGGWTVRAWVAERDLARIETRIAAEREAAAAAALVETERRVMAQKEVADAAERRAQAARRDAAAAAAAAVGLRDRAAALAAAAASCDPAAAAGRPPAADAARMLADVLRLADERAGVLAAIADERGAAGEACQRAYESLTQGAKP